MCDVVDDNYFEPNETTIWSVYLLIYKIDHRRRSDEFNNSPVINGMEWKKGSVLHMIYTAIFGWLIVV